MQKVHNQAQPLLLNKAKTFSIFAESYPRRMLLVDPVLKKHKI